MEHFDSVKTIIENLRSENAELRLESMRAIHVIASALGPRRTRDELLLYLTDYLDDSDDVLCVFATALGTMLAEVGGVAHIASLLKPLEMLCSLDEVTVRDEAVSALQLLGRSIFGSDASSAHRINGLPRHSTTSTGSSSNNNNTNALSAHHVRAREEYIAMITRLTAGTPQSRSSACGLFATVYAHGTEEVQATMLKLFRELCGDKEIMVRRAACIALGTEMVTALGPRRAADWVPTLRDFADRLTSSDGVRLQAVQTAVAMLSVLSTVQHGEVLQIFRALASDESWRVRYMAADALGSLAQAIAAGDVVRHVIPVFKTLCQDAEPEIRASAVYAMPAVLAGCRLETTAGERGSVGGRGERCGEEEVWQRKGRMCVVAVVVEAVV